MAGQSTYRLKREQIGIGEYKILIDGEIHQFTHWDEIPARIEKVILFKPIIPPGPHTPAQHNQINCFTKKFMSIMGRENYAGGS
jgi:hypothetical protein